MKTDLENREDVKALISAFYTKIRKHEILSTFFEIVKDWDEHIEKLTDFWESNIFNARSFRGNPMLKHHIVDARSGYQVDQKHFGHWLQVWFETIDEMYEGPNADKLKEKARNIATMLFMRIYQMRPATAHQGT